MSILQVIASRPLAGKTAVAVALACGLVASTPVRLVRTGSGAAAEADAATYAEYTFASTPGQVLAAGALTGFADNETVIVEPDAGEAPLKDTPTLVVVRGEPTEADAALAKQLGDNLVGSIATDVSPPSIEDVARAMTNFDLRPLALIPEDRAIAAPCVAEIRDILKAQVLYAGENDLETVEDVLVGPVYADPARPHFRRFASKAILAPFNKTDLHLAAIETQAACLVITGGHDPSPYVVDRAQGENTTVLLAPDETPETISSLSDVWLTNRFRGEAKAEAAFGHLNGRLDFAGLLTKLGS